LHGGEPKEAVMAVTVVDKRPSVGARRAGYVIAVLLNAALLVLVNRWPGWEALPFLTTDTRLVIAVVNASVLVNLAANLVYLARDPRWLKALGDTLTTAVGLVAMVRIWQVFPFDFADWSHDWSWLLRVLLGVGMVGSVIGIAVQFISLVRQLANGGAHPGSGTAASPPVH
jgi:hypothetical protein